MKKLLIVFSLFLSMATAVIAQDFVPGTDDIPLMSGLVIDDNETVSFDTPEGQIIEIIASLREDEGHVTDKWVGPPPRNKTVIANTSKSKNQILNFYETTLTSMGWQKITPYFFQRGHDELLLSITTLKNKTQVKFQLTTPNN